MSEGGMVQGVCSALGAASRKRESWKRERASAISLETPGTWRARTKKLRFIDMRTRNLRRSMIRGAFEWPEFMMATTDSLLHQNWTRFPEKCGNQIAHATTMGKSSCHSMLIPRSLFNCMWGDHRTRPEDGGWDGRGWIVAFKRKSSQLCCPLWVDWPPEDEGEERLSIEMQDSLDDVGERW